jgi:hypothetical protein
MFIEMSYPMGIDSWTSESEYNNCFADLTSRWNVDYAWFLYCNPVECIEFLMKLPPFKEHMICAPAKASIQA